MLSILRLTYVNRRTLVCMKVSLITVDYNQPELTVALLTSLRTIRVRCPLEVIVVDNGSRTEASDIIRAAYPGVRFIRSEHNRGFAGGNNLGIQAATGDYLFFINNDTELKEDIITPLVEALEAHPEVGLLCPEIRYFDRPDRVQYLGFTPMNPMTGRNRCLTAIEKETTGLVVTSFPHGAAMMVPCRVIEQVGLMPELFFLYYEEHDWAEMIRRAGYQLAVLPRTIVYHKESMSVSKINALKMYFMTRNRLLFMRRNYGGARLLLFWLYFFLVASPKHLLQLTLRGDWENLRAFGAGIRWNFSSSVRCERIGYKFDHLRTS